MKYLCTGGTGFLGVELIKRLKERGFDDLVVVSRNEGKLVELQERYGVKIIPGDIADSYTCDKAMQGVEGVYHLAAFKFVGLAETNVKTCVESNVIGTLNLLEATRIYKPRFMVGVSTDKATHVNGVYGATKMLQERLFKDYEGINPYTKYRTVRYGNVLYSTGSVLCKWKDKLQRGEEIVLTDPDATRFYWTVDQAVNLIFECLEKAQDSTPFVTPMKAMRVGDLLDAMIERYAVGTPHVRTIGLQPGENMHEQIVEGQDSSMVERFTKKEILELI